MVVSLGWRRSCVLQKGSSRCIHQNLNSISANVLFTLELKDTNGYVLPFLDTITWRRSTKFKWRFTGSKYIQTATLIFSLAAPHVTKDQWLIRYSFVRKTFHQWVNENEKEMRRLKAVLWEDNYPYCVINECEWALGSKQAKPTKWFCSTSLRA